MSFTEPTAPVQAPPVDNLEARWRHLTEALIFAAPYGTTEYLQLLDRAGGRYNQEDALRRRRLLVEAMDALYGHLPIRLLRCHAANDSPTFRHQFASLLPKRPAPILTRPGGTPDERQARADALVATL
jgi:hypothetical protein